MGIFVYLYSSQMALSNDEGDGLLEPSCWLMFSFGVAHTISQRLRTLKRIPPELIPLGKLPRSLASDSLGEQAVADW